MTSVVCDAGHQFDIEDPVYDGTVVAAISWCVLEVVKPDFGNIILPCGERIVWRKKPLTKSG